MSNTQVATADGEATVLLPQILDLAAATALLGDIRQRLGSGAKVRLDGSQVDTVLLPCLQIVLAALRAPSHVIVDAPSEALAAAFADIGLDLQSLLDASRAAIPETCPVMPDPAAMTGAEAVPFVPEGDVKVRIMTIDDSKTMRDMLRLTLDDAGYEVLQAVDGQEGVDMLRTEAVDIIITDINMPRMDGYEVIRQLRARPEHQATPILVLTTESELDKKKIAREVGATGWMVKPFDPDRLVATVRKVVG